MAQVNFTTLEAQEVKTRLMDACDRISVIYQVIDQIYNSADDCEVLPVLKDAKEVINSVPSMLEHWHTAVSESYKPGGAPLEEVIL